MPGQPWDALTDRVSLSGLLQPGLFLLGRWPGLGLHPLTLLQPAAVNAIVHNLNTCGIAAANGPPGTGKTTLLTGITIRMASTAKLLPLNPTRALSSCRASVP